MHESAAQAVLLVRAFEEADPEGRVLPLDERRRATESARAALRGVGEASDDEARLAARASVLKTALEDRIPDLHRLLTVTRIPAGLTWIVAAVMFVVGLAINELGGGPRVPLLKMLVVLGVVLAWNLLLYLWRGVAYLRPTRRRSDPAATRARVPGLASRLLDGAVARFTRRQTRHKVRDAEVIGAAATRYLGSWRRAVAPLIAARTGVAFHVGSMACALGIVAGMVLRGIVRRYDVTWESTFLSADHVHQLSTALLGVAAAVTGRAVPSADEVARLEAPGHGPAATWIVLYGATIASFVVVPRLLLALLDRARAAALSRDLPVEFGVLYAARSGGGGAMPGARVEVVPYSVTLPARSMETLKAALHDVLGTGAEVYTHPPLPYGAEARTPAWAGEAPVCHVVVISTAQTPETEVHGQFLAALLAATRRQDRVLVVADAAALRERLADPARSAERSRLWERVAREAGVPCAVLDLAAPDADHATRLLTALSAAADGAGTPHG